MKFLKLLILERCSGEYEVQDIFHTIRDKGQIKSLIMFLLKFVQYAGMFF